MTSKQDRKIYVHLPLTKGGKSKIRMPDGTILAEADRNVTAKQDRKMYVLLPITKGGKRKIRMPDGTILVEGEGAFVTAVIAGVSSAAQYRHVLTFKLMA